MGKLRLGEVKGLELLTEVWNEQELLQSHFLNSGGKKSSSSSLIPPKPRAVGGKEETEDGPRLSELPKGFLSRGAGGGVAALQREAAGRGSRGWCAGQQPSALA